jgi:hypothetical protein
MRLTGQRPIKDRLDPLATTYRAPSVQASAKQMEKPF